ncbi:MAG: hypothetical protein H0U90_10910 [Actinobacteria bacterium]|nr:hypothetical protein [Actinomycetota bacterium]
MSSPSVSLARSLARVDLAAKRREELRPLGRRVPRADLRRARRVGEDAPARIGHEDPFLAHPQRASDDHSHTLRHRARPRRRIRLGHGICEPSREHGPTAEHVRPKLRLDPPLDI